MTTSWAALRAKLEAVDDQLTFAWDDLGALVGGLPRSAYDHTAYWNGDRSRWAGFKATDVQVGESVTFIRDSTERPVASSASASATRSADIVLVGCGKQKVDHAAPVRDLYTSALFRKGRAYAESTGVPWYVLSAKHGLVAPTKVIEPYDQYLAGIPPADRQAWGERVVAQLLGAEGPLAGKVIEVHASAAYVAPIRNGLISATATVVEPRRGLRQGEQLALYNPARR